MPTNKQLLGTYGEKLVSSLIPCPKCKKSKTLKCLPPNFKCADIICDFCGYLAQVKSKNVKSILSVPDIILSAAWKPHSDRMNAGIFFPLFIVLVNELNKKDFSIHYLSADLQPVDIFVVRNALSINARRAGWQGYYINLKNIKNRLVRII